MANRVRKTLICLVALCALVLPSTASASYQDVIRDCAQDGKLDRGYSNSDLQRAGDKLPSDLDEYSDCREVIAGSLGRSRNQGGGGGGSGSGGGAGASPTEPSARRKDKKDVEGLASGRKKPKVAIGGNTVEPGAGGLLRTRSAENGLPLPLLLALIALGALGVGGAAYALRRRVPALANLPLPRISFLRAPLSRLRR